MEPIAASSGFFDIIDTQAHALKVISVAKGTVQLDDQAGSVIFGPHSGKPGSTEYQRVTAPQVRQQDIVS